MRLYWLPIAGILITLVSGCQCCPLFDCYANVIDDASDTHVYFDRCYNPRWDITRMGRADWCSPFNSRLCPRCCCNQPYYEGHDECHTYPPLYPYEFPSYIMPPPTVRKTRIPRATDFNEMEMPLNPTPDPAPAPVPKPPVNLEL